MQMLTSLFTCYEPISVILSHLLGLCECVCAPPSISYLYLRLFDANYAVFVLNSSFAGISCFGKDFCYCCCRCVWWQRHWRQQRRWWWAVFDIIAVERSPSRKLLANIDFVFSISLQAICILRISYEPSTHTAPMHNVEASQLKHFLKYRYTHTDIKHLTKVTENICRLLIKNCIHHLKLTVWVGASECVTYFEFSL